MVQTFGDRQRHVRRKRIYDSVLLFDSWSTGTSSTIEHCPVSTIDFRELHDSGNELHEGNLAPASDVIRDAQPQCRKKVNSDLVSYSPQNGLSN